MQNRWRVKGPDYNVEKHEKKRKNQKTGTFKIKFQHYDKGF